MRRILVVTSEAVDQESLVAPIARAGYAVETIAHQEAVAHISREDMAAYAAVVVAVRDETSTLSAAYRLGQYVLHYLEQLHEDVLSRVIVVTSSARLVRSPRVRVLIEPATAEDLLAEVRSVAV